MRQDAIKQAERERRDKYKKQEDEREGIRAGIREKVSGAQIEGLGLGIGNFDLTDG